MEGLVAAQGAHDHRRLAYIPSLDGVRALAVLGVMVFHGGIPFLPAGFLGVDAFFVLSGFLITTLLLTEWHRTAMLRLREFWARRARRLLPAVMLVVVFVVLYGTLLVPAGTYPDLRSDALATLFYVANWHYIAIGSNYFVQTSATSPLTHTWSLAIEEQFYLVWPLVVLGLMRVFGRLRPLLVVAVVGALGSGLEMALLYHDGSSLSRLYYGTDTHAQSLLVGVALAVALAMVSNRRRDQETGTDPVAHHETESLPTVTSRNGQRAMLAVGVAGLVVDGLLWWRLTYDSSFLWQGGFLLADVATAAVLASVVCIDRSYLTRLLSLSPLRYLGRISYGLYLWHFPLFQWIDGARTGLTGYPLFGVRLLATTAVATASYYLVERPIRRGTLIRQWRAWLGTPAAVGGVVALVVTMTASVGAATVSSLPAASTARGTSAAGRHETVMIVGDSTAVTLDFDLSVDASKYGVRLVDKGILGCGVAEISEVSTGATTARVASPCNPATPASARWPALWTKSLARYRPSVVIVLAGRWEVYNAKWDGKWTNISTPAFARYVRTQLTEAVTVASATGAHVDLLTAPCYSGQEQLDGAPLPANTPKRVSRYNQLVRQVAAKRSPVASLVNLYGLVCPGGQYHQTIGDVTVRAPDGVHFPFYTRSAPRTPDPDTEAEVDAFGRWMGPRLWPQLLSRATTASKQDEGSSARG